VNEIGSKGVGQISLIGFAAAVTNAVYNATGKRVRDLPITKEKLGFHSPQRLHSKRKCPADISRRGLRGLKVERSLQIS